MKHHFHSPVQLQHGLKVFSTLPEHLHSPCPQQLCPWEEVSFFTVSSFCCLSKKYPCSDPQGIPGMMAEYGNIQQGKLMLTHVPFLRKPAPAHHCILFCWALLQACFTGLILATRAFCSILIFLYERKLRIKLAKPDLLTLLNEARVD